MKLQTRYRNYKFLKRIKKKPSILTRRVYKVILDNYKVFDVYRDFKKQGRERRILSEVIRIGRELYPYNVIGWDENKKEYEKYFKIDNHIPSINDLENKLSKGDVFVTRIGDDSYYRSEDNPFRYGGISSWSISSNRVSKVYKKRDSLYLSDSSNWIDNEHIQMYRYSTQEEIDEYLDMSSKVEHIESLIGELYKEIRQKEGEISELKKDNRWKGRKE